MSDESTQAIVDFLLARYAEEEDAWRSGAPALPQNSKTFARHMLADIAAKRAVVEELAPEATGLDMQVDNEFAVGPRDTTADPYLGDAILLTLVQPYRDHAGFNAEWAPDGMRGFL